jgi:hypothetical protein
MHGATVGEGGGNTFHAQLLQNLLKSIRPRGILEQFCFLSELTYHLNIKNDKFNI